jgi:hypothetical protein
MLSPCHNSFNTELGVLLGRLMPTKVPNIRTPPINDFVATCRAVNFTKRTSFIRGGDYVVFRLRLRGWVPNWFIPLKTRTDFATTCDCFTCFSTSINPHFIPPEWGHCSPTNHPSIKTSDMFQLVPYNKPIPFYS